MEAKEEVHKLRTEFERESRERRNEIQRLERRLVQKEEALDRKSDNLEKKDDILNKKIKDLDEKGDQINQICQRQLDELEKISGLTSEEAKELLLNDIRKEIKHEAAMMIKDIEQKAKEEGEKKAKEIIAYSIQKCAADHVAETTVSVVVLPNDEMKGRIIGREGRNIRALETLTDRKSVV